MDFFRISIKEGRKGDLEAYPDFRVGRSKDLMVRGRSFYAIWDEEAQLWSTDEYNVQRFVDAELREFAKEHPELTSVKYMEHFSTNNWNQFMKFIKQLGDNSHQLDQTLTFANTETKKTDYVSRRLPYELKAGDYSAWDEIVGTLYSPEERAKIEWAIGGVVSGDSKKNQKFLVFYGDPGTGKGTVLDIILKLFPGYSTTFDGKALGSSSNGQFATDAFKDNPLVAVQHDVDLSRMDDNTRLNSIISHEDMRVEEKYKPSYTTRINAFLFMGTNKPVLISDGKSGIIRRLIDVHPVGTPIPPNHYHSLMARVDFELGAIAHHCLDVYRKMGKNYYSTYRPLEMMFRTDIFFNFIEDSFDVFKYQDGITLKQAYAMYVEFCNNSGIDKKLPQYKFRGELKNYFEKYHDRFVVDGETRSSYFSGFKTQVFQKTEAKVETPISSLVLDHTVSLLDELFADQPAQYGKADETPRKYWTNEPRMINEVLTTPKPSQVVSTVLSDLDTSKLHFVKVPTNHVVIDFDLTDENGNKSLELNLSAASKFPPTYAECSKSGSAVHLHYDYDGDADELARVFSPGIEIKVYRGDASLRRRVSRCNNVPVLQIDSGLPLREKKLLAETTIQSERGLRELLERNLKKKILAGTKPSIDFIHKILEDAYHEGKITFDVTDMRPRIVAFANNSSNQAPYCIQRVLTMKWKSAEPSESIDEPKDVPVTIFDVEVFPNLFKVGWSYEDDDAAVVLMTNPTPDEVEKLFKMKLVGFNNRDYDNHMLWARYMGYSNKDIYRLSKKIIDEKKAEARFGDAFNVSYADIHDMASEKMSLKKWQFKLGIRHQELNIPWDEPVPEERWAEIDEYLTNDVLSTKALFKARKGDFIARQILADLSQLKVNDKTSKHAARIIFKGDRNPQASFVYTRLAEQFPGYVYEAGKSTYRGVVTGEGGLVYAEPGMYENVALLDVDSMHPTSIRELNLFGEYTKNFWDLVEARLAIKRGDYDAARKMMNGRLAPYLKNAENDKKTADALSDALKIAINSVYGLTSARFDNSFKDKRNVDNIVAKRGALFMLDLKLAVEERGFTVAHIKTDSIKIPHATPEIIQFVKDFGAKYGYNFSYKPEKDFYEKFCLVNDAVYIARKGDEWEAVGAQFQHPYVYKGLFTQEPIMFDDLCEIKEVKQGKMFLDFDSVKSMAATEWPTKMHFIGKTGRFVPVNEGFGGGELLRVKDDKTYAVTGTKGYLWVEAEVARILPGEAINMSYYERLAEAARETIDHWGPFHDFVA